LKTAESRNFYTLWVNFMPPQGVRTTHHNLDATANGSLAERCKIAG